MDALADRFRRFAEFECKATSPLYSSLCARIADCPELLALAQSVPANQPLANLFLGAVNYLLTREGEGFRSSGSDDEEFERMLRVTRQSRTEFLDLLQTRLVQTNEVRRSIYLYCALLRTSIDFPRRPFALVEIGASAGLNLRLDRYEFQFAGGPVFGREGSPVRIFSELRGDRLPPYDLPCPDIRSRVGLDLNPVDTEKEDDVQWLTALIWPEHADRRQLLRAAIQVRNDTAVELKRGDGVALLPTTIASIPDEEVVFLFHTHVANQLSEESRGALLEMVDEVGRHRDIVHVHNSILPHLHASIRGLGRDEEIPLANSDGHARWVEWLDSTHETRSATV